MKMPASELGPHDVHMRLVLAVDIPLMNWLNAQARQAEGHVMAPDIAVAILRDVMNEEGKGQ